MKNRDHEMDRAGRLFEQVRPELLKVLGNAPEYGGVGLDVTLHQGEITRIVVRAEVTRKLETRAGSAGLGHGA